MPQNAQSQVIRLSRLPVGAPTPFVLEPDPRQIQELKAALDLLDLREVRLAGQLIPEGRADWRLEATLGATVVQPCSVTLEPVTTRIDTPVLRRYLAGYTAPDDAEAEMPEDDSIEPLPASVDLGQVLGESLALALPDFPRAAGAELAQADFTAPGTAPMTDDDARPFAGLAGLRRQLDPKG
ncbi:YceD family protein [Tropicimonas sp.]|uniref:YceD family protein n=1 Tax=Tropicimonas sp. TaxID=2067044 RepID=UPI003A88DC0C